jgi:hypothetical protein
MPSGRPRKRVKIDENYPCSVCDINCDVGSIQCATCAKWVHASCEGFDPDHDLPELSDNYKFVCSVCIRESDKGTYNFQNALCRLHEVSVSVNVKQISPDICF